MSVTRFFACVCAALLGLWTNQASATHILELGGSDILLMVTQVAGILLLLGTMILLFFRRVVLDAETKKAIKFKLPIIGEISTQTPVIVLVFVGTFMVVYPLSQMRASVVPLEGNVDTGGDAVSILIVAVPDYEQVRHTPGLLKANIPLLNTSASYRVIYVVDKQIIDEKDAEIKDGRIVLDDVQWERTPTAGSENEIIPKKEISDAEVAKILH